MTYSTWCCVTPLMASNVLMLEPSETIHRFGEIGFQPRSSSVQMTADADPLDHCHLDLDMAISLYNLCHDLRIRDLVTGSLRSHNAIRDLIWFKGIVTLGSADKLVNRPVLNVHFMAVVAQAPAPERPVASAMLVLQAVTLVGAMPTAV